MHRVSYMPFSRDANRLLVAIDGWPPPGGIKRGLLRYMAVVPGPALTARLASPPTATKALAGSVAPE